VLVARERSDPLSAFIITRIQVSDYEARQRLLESGVLDRFEGKHGSNVVEEADAARS
jgi:hypothetical protein